MENGGIGFTDYACLCCEEKFATEQEFDEHNQTLTHLERMLESMQEYKQTLAIWQKVTEGKIAEVKEKIRKIAKENKKSVSK